MNNRISRRAALKTAGALSAAAVALQYPAPFVSASLRNNEKLNIALIGCGERGRGHLPGLLGENLVAVADPDESRACFALRDISGRFNTSRIQTFIDYRQMYDKIEKQIDAVFVVTPDHQHANPSLRGIKSGKHVYCEKCLTHAISEARVLGDAARQAKVVTQMGNQGSGTGNHQLLAEYLQAGAIGKVFEVHAWCGWRPMRFGCQMDYPEGDLAEMPEVHWSEWLGPAKERFYSDYFRCEWYGWFDFATGSLGGWGTHIMDAVFFALKLRYPTSVELVEASQLSADRFPRHATIRFDFPSRGELQPVKVFWYDGSLPNPKDLHRSIPHYPPLYHEIRKKYGEAGKALG
ncbi:MAG: Gfo/Idh/MocA family oxidoreductase, partial [Thermoguttaceae bacterium]